MLSPKAYLSQVIWGSTTRQSHRIGAGEYSDNQSCVQVHVTLCAGLEGRQKERLLQKEESSSLETGKQSNSRVRRLPMTEFHSLPIIIYTKINKTFIY